MTFNVIIFGFALWFGLYLIARNPASPPLRYTGLGLVAYALALASDLLLQNAPTSAMALWLSRLQWAALLLPPLCWSGAAAHLLPDTLPLRQRFIAGWRYGLVPLVGSVVLLVSSSNVFLVEVDGVLQAGTWYPVIALVATLPTLVALVTVGWMAQHHRSQHWLVVLLVTTIFFGLGVGALVAPLEWIPRSWLLLLIGGDLVLLGWAVAVMDALAADEILLLDWIRSLDMALVVALLFGGLVGLTIVFGTGLTFPMLTLLLATVALAITIQTLNDLWQKALDRIAFARLPRLRQARTELRAATSALPRVNDSLNLAELDTAEFVRLTRRALSNFGDLPRLATSPLTYLPLIDARLQQRGVQGDTLERAAELKTILAETIARLKPREPDGFGVSDEWRYYNALYFPYVIGIKPYSQRAEHNGLDPAAQAALEWFRTSVPERTLYNWQNAAARLVAQDLRERIDHVTECLSVGAYER